MAPAAPTTQVGATLGTAGKRSSLKATAKPLSGAGALIEFDRGARGAGLTARFAAASTSRIARAWPGAVTGVWNAQCVRPSTTARAAR